jgi:hypothetical protein
VSYHWSSASGRDEVSGGTGSDFALRADLGLMFAL